MADLGGGKTIFMRLWGVDFIPKELQTDLSKGKYFYGGQELVGAGTWTAISSFGFSGARPFSMPLGEDQGHMKVGNQVFSALGVTKALGPSSEKILSRLFVPPLKGGGESKYIKKKHGGGDTYTFVVTNGTGDMGLLNVIMQLNLVSSHVISYNLGGSTGTDPFESIQIAYGGVEIQSWHFDDEKSDYKEGGAVAYDLMNRVATSFWRRKS
ncbi:hypothetical protein [Candidatus Sororendozoicomonas aggregata]|uniref:hypothetical protein n=1 Tax=Candidatus Sororendozoicomonas aggregata TaxID=3073239 RepID=UPI002ED24345